MCVCLLKFLEGERNEWKGNPKKKSINCFSFISFRPEEASGGGWKKIIKRSVRGPRRVGHVFYDRPGDTQV